MTKRFSLPVNVTNAAARGANGYGYVLAQDDPLNQTATVHVFAPGCGP